MATTNTSGPMRQVSPSICPVTGDCTYTLNLTESQRADHVRLTLKPVHALPIVFVPGIMGSNLKATTGKDKGGSVWRLDGELEMLKNNGLLDAGARQKALHPQRTAVDDRGALPEAPAGSVTRPEQFKARGWSEVGATSYQEFLLWLEDSLNGGGTQGRHAALNRTLEQVRDGRTQWGAMKAFAALTTDESDKSQQWFYPVHAFGYNWLDDNGKAATKLAERIDDVIKLYQKNGVCRQVILVTHSMGGLVARACSQLPGMEEKIAGVVHGVMPAVGAAVAYRRCKVGMADEGSGAQAWGAAKVIGYTGREVTAVFAQAPGALQLLPTKQYPQRQWLKIVDAEGTPLPEQPNTDDPYGPDGVYAEQKKWWGLIKEEWLNPPEGQPIDWTTYLKTLDKASRFHDTIKDHYHPNTWGFYSSKVSSFAQVCWTLHDLIAGQSKDKSPQDITRRTHAEVRLEGDNRGTVLEKQKIHATPGHAPIAYTPTPGFELRLDPSKDSGDGTVPIVSGAYPANPVQSLDVQQRIRQFFEVSSVGHEPAYKHPVTQLITAYAIAKIAAAVPSPYASTSTSPRKP